MATLPPMEPRGGLGAMVGAANAAPTMLGSPGGGPPRGAGAAIGLPNVEQMPPEAQQGLAEIVAMISRDPANAMQYIELARERFGVDLSPMLELGVV